MTTKNSPLRVLKQQADKIAQMIAAFERGEAVDPKYYDKLQEARARESVKFGIIMDDKVITIELPWTTIKSSGEVAMSEYILRQMKEQRDTLQ